MSVARPEEPAVRGFEILRAFDHEGAQKLLARKVIDLYRHSQLRLRDIAHSLEIPERLVKRIVERAGAKRKKPLAPDRFAGGIVDRWHNDPERLRRIANYQDLASLGMPLFETDVDDLRERIGLFLLTMALLGHRIRFRR